MFHFGEDKLTTRIALEILRNKMESQISARAIEKIESSHRQVLKISEGEKAVYGINTGFGPLCTTIISKTQTFDLQRNILLSHSVGVGNPIAKEIAKLMLILKVHALAKGHSGVSMRLLERIIWHISEDIIPLVPEQGSVGASGDLAPLSHLFLPLIGEGKVYYKDKITDAREVLSQFSLEALKLGPKAGLALINGTQFIAAHAVMLVDQMHSCLDHADLIAAMMIDSQQGSKAPFHPDLHMTRPYPGTRYVAHRIKQLLDNSQIMDSHANCDKVQDPYSLRCIPQVHGASRHAWLHLKQLLEIEINAVTDNPVLVHENLVISGGNFHGQPLAMVLDYACLALSELGNISDRRTYLSLEGKTPGVPKLLTRNAGVHSGFMILQYTSAALASENKSLCYPASADSIPTSLGQEDHVSMGSISARKALQVCQNLKRILAIELLCAAQSIDFHRPLKSSNEIEKMHQLIRKQISHAAEDRIFSLDIEKATEIIESRILVNELHLNTGELEQSIIDDYHIY